MRVTIDIPDAPGVEISVVDSEIKLNRQSIGKEFGGKVSLHIEGNVLAVGTDGDVTCQTVNGGVRAGGNVTANVIMGSVNAVGTITANRIDGKALSDTGIAKKQ